MSRPINPRDAELLQSNAVESGDLLVWTVYEKPKDFPDHYIARPFATRGGERPLAVHLQARTLSELRQALPFGLAPLARNPADDPVIVECWI